MDPTPMGKSSTKLQGKFSTQIYKICVSFNSIGLAIEFSHYAAIIDSTDSQCGENKK
jgi:hypothetical protein